eukprot:gene29098-32308_t
MTRAVDAFVHQEGHEDEPDGELTETDDESEPVVERPVDGVAHGMDWEEILRGSLADGTQTVYGANIKTLQGKLADAGFDVEILTIGLAMKYWDLERQRLKDGKVTYAYNTYKAHHSAMAHWWLAQGVKNSKLLLVDSVKVNRLSDYSKYRMLKNSVLRMKRDSERVAHQDPSKGTAADSYTYAQYTRLAKITFVMWHYVFWSCMIRVCHQTLGRNDDALLIGFAHMMVPVHDPTVGPDLCWVMNFILKGNKTSKDNRAKYLSLVRHENIEVSGVHSLARLIFMDFTLGDRVLPSPYTHWVEFLKYPLFGRGNTGKAVTYSACRQAIGPLLLQASIIISKVCHAFRAGGARVADMFGAALDMIKRLGHWLETVCTDVYVVGAPSGAVVALAGFVTGYGHKLREAYYSERFGIGFESKEQLEELIHAVLPWLGDFKVEADKCPVDAPCARHCHAFLEHLGEVLVQDAVFLAATPRDPAPRVPDPVVEHLSKYPQFHAAVTLFQNRRAAGLTAKPLTESSTRKCTCLPHGVIVLDSGWTQHELLEYAPAKTMLNNLTIKTAWELYKVGLGAKQAPPLFGRIYPSIAALDKAWEGNAKHWWV